MANEKYVKIKWDDESAPHYSTDCTEKAWSIWYSICCMWFDYDAARYVTDKAYDLHVDIDILLTNGVM